MTYPNGPSRLASDRTPLLTPWSAKDEAELRDAQERIERAKARRLVAEQRVCDVLIAAGITGVEAAIFAIRHADDIRDALAPFDSGVRAS